MKNSTIISKDYIEVFFENLLKEEFKSENGEYFAKIVYDDGEVVVDWNLDIEKQGGNIVQKITVRKIRGNLTFIGMREKVEVSDIDYWNGNDSEEIILDIERLNWSVELQNHSGLRAIGGGVAIRPEDIEFDFATETIKISF